MAIRSISLRKLLLIMFADSRLRTSKIREEIRSEIKVTDGDSSEGGDFHTAFWSDAKKHVIGELDLNDAVEDRVERSRQRRRLYPLLRDGFLGWWNEKRRWRNEPLNPLNYSVNARLQVDELSAEVK